LVLVDLQTLEAHLEVTILEVALLLVLNRVEHLNLEAVLVLVQVVHQAQELFQEEVGQALVQEEVAQALV